MDRLFTRRRFGQAAIAGTTLAGLAYLTGKKTLAKSSINNLIGVGSDVATGALVLKSINLSNLQVLNETKNPVNSFTSQAFDDTKNAVNPLGLQILDVTKNFIKKEVELVNTLEELTGFSSINGELQLTTSSVRNQTVKDSADGLLGRVSDLLGTDRKPKKEQKQKQNLLKTIGNSNSNTLTITGLNKDEKIKSVETLDQYSLVAIVTKNSVFGSGRIVNVSLSKGNIISTGFSLPKTHNFSTLTQGQDGTIYASSTAPTGYTSIVQIDLAKQTVTQLVQLNFNGKVWNNGLAGLAASPTGEVIALGAPRYVAKNNLYKVDLKTGALTLLLAGFDVDKIAFQKGN